MLVYFSQVCNCVICVISASFVIVSQRTQLVAYEFMSHHVYDVVTSSIILVIIGSGISYMVHPFTTNGFKNQSIVKKRMEQVKQILSFRI